MIDEKYVPHSYKVKYVNMAILIMNQSMNIVVQDVTCQDNFVKES